MGKEKLLRASWGRAGPAGEPYLSHMFNHTGSYASE